MIHIPSHRGARLESVDALYVEELAVDSASRPAFREERLCDYWMAPWPHDGLAGRAWEVMAQVRAQPPLSNGYWKCWNGNLGACWVSV
jgi:hypothetical protein